MLLNTVLSAPNAELEVDFVILLDLGASACERRGR